jgi:DNA-directed RNA polymerase subunit RPC12/RpoP
MRSRRHSGATAQPLNLTVRWHVNELKLIRAWRLYAILAAVASWLFVGLMVPILVFPHATLHSRYFFGGMALCGAFWLMAVLSSLSLRCPRCGARIGFLARKPKAAPDWVALRQQFFPTAAVLGNTLESACPQCGAKVPIGA